MTCTVLRAGSGRYGRAIVCTTPFYRLWLADGRHVFMDWHDYCGPMFYRDRASRREIEEWWEDPKICDALDWFIKRGKRA